MIAENGGKIKLWVTDSIPDVGRRFMSEEVARQELRALGDVEKKAITHPLTVHVTGSMSQINIVAALVFGKRRNSSNPLCHSPDIRRIDDDEWDNQPKCSGRSNSGHESSLAPDLATVDDVRRLLGAIKANGLEIEPGQERLALDKGVQIIQDLAIGRT